MAANLWVGGGSTKRVNLLARFVKGRRRRGASSAIHLRSPARSGRPKAGSEERSSVEGSARASHFGSLCWKDGGHSLPGEAVRKALRKPGFSLGWGVERPAAQRMGSNWGRVAGHFPMEQSDRHKK
jgi:hypothetical protein